MDFDYVKTNNEDMIRVFKKFLDNGVMVYKADGSLELQISNQYDTPWYYVRPDEERRCMLLHDIVSPAIQNVPIRCQGCWKVVVRPRTLKELMQLAELEENCEYFCKCGMERRPFVHGNYGGYFYFNTKEEGVAGFEDVRKLVSEQISPKVPVILKRGCTEFERDFGDSRYWTIRGDQAEVEKRILGSFTLSDNKVKQPPLEVLNLKRRWVEFACDRGDSTYLEFTKGHRLDVPVHLYGRHPE